MRVWFALLAVLLAFSASPARADFAAGKAAYDRKDWTVAITTLRPLAEQGDAPSLFLLGNMYAQGYGVSRDPAQAYQLYRRAALIGNAEAMVVTGAMLQQGLGTPVNTVEAIEWYARGAKAGNAGGALFYGLYFYTGNQSPQGDSLQPDHAQAYKWLRIAEKNGGKTALADNAGKIATEVARSLSAEDLAAMDQQVAAWQPVPPAQLGPPPGSQPRAE